MTNPATTMPMNMPIGWHDADDDVQDDLHSDTERNEMRDDADGRNSMKEMFMKCCQRMMAMMNMGMPMMMMCGGMAMMGMMSGKTAKIYSAELNL